MRVITYAESVV